MCSPPLKRKRVETPANVTNKIRHYKIFHPRASVTEIRDFINKETSQELGLTTIRETLKNRNITTDARALRTRHALHEDSSDTEEGSGEEVPVAIWEALTAVRTLIQFLKFHKRTAESEDRKWMSGVLVNLRRLRGTFLEKLTPGPEQTRITDFFMNKV
ncbi:uncharacterized protein LOC128182688 isoform X2 [Crassostrea angulata]|uniref:uncharacterized protein LOC128182688 isoform X2 n=1 Tax=Magallana angulata TaxID=2784310 RepID=UPI0022B148DD|nr:uncharacterized protein LOC128182688 isoform X2 [Crassostrea angulata]